MSRAVLAPFEAYQKARVTFVQTIAELAQRPQNIEALQSAGKFNRHTKSRVETSDDQITLSLNKVANFRLGVMALLRPLLLDNVPSIQ